MKALYVADTMALARYLEDNLPKRANEVFEKAETGNATILVPDIAIAEFIYIGLKGRLKVSDPRATITELLSDLQSSQFLRPVGMSSGAWAAFIDSRVPELHDRLIYSTAVTNEADAIITNDPEIIASAYPTIW
jgi:predicted nucleic acid-binding protein